jgi:hypothetical protein
MFYGVAEEERMVFSTFQNSCTPATRLNESSGREILFTHMKQWVHVFSPILATQQFSFVDFV